MQRNRAVWLCALIIFLCSALAGCEDETFIEVFKGDITLRSHKEIDNFPSYITKVEGCLTVGPEKVGDYYFTSIEGLKNLTSVTDLVIRNSETLTNLNGLQNLRNVDYLNLHHLTKVNSLEELSGLESLNSLNLHDLWSLKNLCGLEGIESLDGLKLISCGIEDLSALSDLTSIGYNVHLEDLDIVNLEGLHNIPTIRQLDIFRNPLLKDLSAFNNMDSLIMVRIRSNHGLDTLHAFQNLKYLGSLTLEWNNNLVKIDSFNLLKPPRGLAFKSNSSLIDLEILTNIERLEDFLAIRYSNLENLDDLQHLTNVGWLTIENNLLLSDFCGLENLVNNGEIDRYRVNNNLFNPTVQELQDGLCQQ